jgi:ankyrin repeat protein
MGNTMDNMSPIGLACLYNQPWVVQDLVEKNGSVIIKNDDTKYACKYRHLDILKFLVEKGATIHEECVLLACLNNDILMVDYLIGKGATIHINCTLAASKNNNILLLKYLIEKGAIIHTNCTFWASKNNNMSMLIFLMIVL